MSLQNKYREEIKGLFRRQMRTMRNTYSGLTLRELQNILLSVAIDLAVVESELSKRVADVDTMWCICPSPINEEGMCKECGYPCYHRGFLEKEVLEKLAANRENMKELGEIHSDESIMREVVASMKLAK